MTVQTQLIILGVAALAAIAITLWFLFRHKETSEARERRRRQILHENGRIGEAYVTGANDNEIFYEYTLRGVQYSASQDVSSLRGSLPEDLESLVGSAGMKYSTKNPVQSILVCEEWSGLRTPAPVVPMSADVNLVRSQAQNPAAGQRPVEQRVKRQAAS